MELTDEQIKKVIGWCEKEKAEEQIALISKNAFDAMHVLDDQKAILESDRKSQIDTVNENLKAALEALK